MALYPCRECKAKVSEEAATCPRCGVAQPVSPDVLAQQRRKGKIVAISLAGLSFLVLISTIVNKLAPTPAPVTSTSGTLPAAPVTTSGSKPYLRVTVQPGSYRHGYLTLTGVLRNDGSSDAYSPAITVRVYNGATLLAEDTTYAAGTMLKTLSPQQSAAFESISRVPGAPANITYQIAVKDYPFTVEQ